MPFKTVISKNPSQVRMIRKEHPKHIPNFSFIPICCFEHFTCRIKWSQLISICFNPNSRIVSQWQQVVYHLHNRTNNKSNNINGCLQYNMLNSLFHAKFTNNLFFWNLWNYSIISQKLRLFILVKIRFQILMVLNVKFGVSVVTPWHLVDQFQCFWENSCVIFRAVILHTQQTWYKIFNGLVFLYKPKKNSFLGLLDPEDGGYNSWQQW